MHDLTRACLRQRSLARGARTRRRSSIPAATSSICCAGSPARRSSKSLPPPGIAPFRSIRSRTSTWSRSSSRPAPIGKVVVAFGEPGPQDHTVRVSGRDASVRGNLLYRRRRPARRSAAPADDRAAAAVEGRGEDRRPEPLSPAADEPAAVRHGADGRDACAFSREGPDAEYGAAGYPVRLYEHSLACVGAIEDFVGGDSRSTAAAVLDRRSRAHRAGVPRRRRVVPHEPRRRRAGASTHDAARRACCRSVPGPQ